MDKKKIRKIQKKAQKEIKASKNLTDLNNVFKSYLGKKGELSEVFRFLKELKGEEKKKVGQMANQVKNLIEEEIGKKSKKIRKTEKKKEKEEWFDITMPGKEPVSGHLHPLTQAMRKIMDIFKSMGFEIINGPQMESEWYNFDALNFPKDHPARDIQDTLFIQQSEKERAGPKQRLLMRTHTSPVQVRYMEQNQPPFRIIVPGRVFRHEATDARHEINFYQVEGLMVGKDVSVANFRAVFEEFFRRFFDKKVKIVLRPGYFPFTEPSFEIDCSCPICGGKGKCSTCSGTGWLEIMGAGMVHPNVLKAGGLNPKHWQGFAFGGGVDRLVMIKHKIDDIRLFYSSDLRFLNQF